MNCCVHCISNAEIQAIIKGQNKHGTCDFCKKNNVCITDISTNDEIKNYFERLIDIYSPAKYKPDKFPKERMDMLKNILSTQWDIFNMDPNNIYIFLVNLLSDKYAAQPELFDSPVGIFEIVNRDYLKQYSILGEYQWEDFVKEIKGNNRFHTNIINKDVLSDLLQSSFKKYKKGEILFRARICPTQNGFSKKEMGAPPPNIASAGRANPKGIRCLYLADSVDTTLHEIRAAVYDYVTVGKFVLQQDIEVINLSGIHKLSPFNISDINLIAANTVHLNKISEDIAKPLRRYDSDLDYLPTQYICDFIKSENFAGIEYSSTMHTGGKNYAIFDESLFKCTKTTVFDIKSINYTYSECN